MITIKYPKATVEFEHPAKGPHHCGACVHFISGENKCKIVAGRVEPGDWCKKWEGK